VAASLLREQGFAEVKDLAGGINAWEKEGHPLAAAAAA
jgi:rhodanese-related sulfurtransferase